MRMGKHRKHNGRSITPLVVSGAVLGGTWLADYGTCVWRNLNSTLAQWKLIDDIPVAVRADHAAYRRVLTASST